MKIAPQIVPPFPRFRDDAFTLIELLVVIRIICILAAMLLPSLAKGKSQALSVVCKNHLHQMGLGLQMYADANNGAYPLWLQPPPAGTTDYLNQWDSFLSRYDKMPPTNATSHCPVYVQNQGVFAFVEGDHIFGSYAINSSGFADPEAATQLGIAPSPPTGHVPIRESQILMPGEMFAIGDTREYHAAPGQAPYITTNATSFGFNYLEPFNGGSGEVIIDPGAGTNEFAPPYAAGYNVLHADGHVPTILRRAILYPPVAAPHWNNDNKPHRELWPPKSEWAVQQ